jgi:hypothetical protein
MHGTTVAAASRMKWSLVPLTIAFAGCVACAPSVLSKTPNDLDAVRARAGAELGCIKEDVQARELASPRGGSERTYAVTACGTVATYTCRTYRERCASKGCVSAEELACVHDASASFDGLLRRTAARDLSCQDLAVRPRTDLGGATFDVAGCGTTARYVCFEAPDASHITQLTCRGRRLSSPVVATWGTPP